MGPAEPPRARGAGESSVLHSPSWVKPWQPLTTETMFPHQKTGLRSLRGRLCVWHRAEHHWLGLHQKQGPQALGEVAFSNVCPGFARVQ